MKKSKPPSKLFDLNPGVHTKYKPFLQKDKTVIKKIMTGTKTKRPMAAQSALLRRHLLELTQSFIIPLERYMASLMPLQKDISPFKAPPNPNQFKQDDFLATLGQSGPQLTSTLKGDWEGLYKKFFRSPNFKGWFENRHFELTQKLQVLQLKALSEAVSLSSCKLFCIKIKIIFFGRILSNGCKENTRWRLSIWYWSWSNDSKSAKDHLQQRSQPANSRQLRLKINWQNILKIWKAHFRMISKQFSKITLKT